MNIQRVRYKDIEQIPHLHIKKDFKQDFQGTAPAPFIGRFGYPYVNVGILSPQIMGETSQYDSPRHWSNSNTSIGQVASLRYSLVNSRTQATVKQLSGKFLDVIKEVGMAKRPAEVEVALKTKPSLKMNSEREVTPFGPGSEMMKARITSNVNVDSRVERVISDTDLKASSAIIDLYKKGFEESTLNKLISVGNLGIKNNRKLVPTRWSITAVDDTIGKELIKDIKDFSVGEYAAYFGGEWGNYYLLLFFPEVWSFELFETYLASPVNPWSKGGHKYSTDYEAYEGRKNYAEETAGGYYACRIGVLEKIKMLKRQQSCLALRFITPEYNIPLGVWVCREATRKSTETKPIYFGDEKLLLQYARTFIQNKFGFDLDLLLKESKLLKEKKQQVKLKTFFT
ncbi:MAG: hypothetical protein Q8Q01_01645 [archaeon]|nr:hypothetical protein [archaeon]